MANTKKIYLCYSQTGVFSIDKGRLSSIWEARSISGGPISRENLVEIFLRRLRRSNDEKSVVVAEVEILNRDLDGVTRLKLLEHARLQSRL